MATRAPSELTTKINSQPVKNWPKKTKSEMGQICAQFPAICAGLRWGAFLRGGDQLSSLEVKLDSVLQHWKLDTLKALKSWSDAVKFVCAENGTSRRGALDLNWLFLKQNVLVSIHFNAFSEIDYKSDRYHLHFWFIYQPERRSRCMDTWAAN